MIWLGWRQQRTETLIAAAMLAAIVAVLVPTGLTIASAYDHDSLAACAGAGGRAGCESAVNAFLMRFGHLGDLMDWLTLLPGLIGVLLAAPLITGLENGTHRLDWTQSITRERWLAARLGLAVATALGAALALTLLVTWWRGPFVHLEGRMDNSIFDSEGTVPMAYALFALGVAVAIGVFWRRTVPALVIAFVVYFAARLFGDLWLRQRLLAPEHLTTSAHRPPPDLGHAWVIDQYPSDQHGHAVAAGLCDPGPCRLEQGPDFLHFIYQPASRFWALQGIETGIFAALAAVLLAVAVRRVRRM